MKYTLIWQETLLGEVDADSPEQAREKWAMLDRKGVPHQHPEPQLLSIEEVVQDDE